MDGRTWTKLAVASDLREKLLRGAPGIVIDHAGFLADPIPSGPS